MGRLESEQLLEHEQVETARRNGILRPDEPVSGTLSLYTHRVPTFWQIPLFFPIRFLFFRERYLLAVTDRRVVLVSVAANGLRHCQGRSVSTELPCDLHLAKPANPAQQVLYHAIHLPHQLADFAGRPFLFAACDVKAESIIKLASAQGSAAAA